MMCTKVTYWHIMYRQTQQSFHQNCRNPSLATRSVAFRLITQEILRKWESLARESTFMCNQAACFSHCLAKVHNSRVTHLKVIQDEKAKGKSGTKTQEAADELAYLMAFNKSITNYG